jgi:hypothetical protein
MSGDGSAIIGQYERFSLDAPVRAKYTHLRSPEERWRERVEDAGWVQAMVVERAA